MVAQAVAHRTTDREVRGSNPAAAGSWAFFSLFSFLSFILWRVLNQVPRGGATLLVLNFLRKMKCLAVQLEVKQA